MSTPTMSRATYDAQAPSLTNGAPTPHFFPPLWMRLDDLLGVALELQAAGYPIGDTTSHARALLAATREATNPTDGPGWRVASTNVLELTPEAAAEIARQIAAESLVHRDQHANKVADEAFASALYQPVADAFRGDTLPALDAMAKDFDAALDKVRKARRAQLTAQTTADEILTNGTTAQVAAFRDLGPAIATLNRLAALRIRLCNIAELGPSHQVIACLVTDTTDLGGALAVYTGETRPYLVPNENPSVGPAVRTVAKPRLGGPWLALLENGYTPRLNTADEADAVAANAKEN